MPEIIIPVADSLPCSDLGCGFDVPFEDQNCPQCGVEQQMIWSPENILAALSISLIIDIRAGGLVIGRDSREDDVPMFTPVTENLYRFAGYMQGGEFVVRASSTAEHKDRLEEINSYRGTESIITQGITITNDIQIFNTNVDDDFVKLRDVKSRRLIIAGGQFIVNRAATAKYFNELVEINKSEPVYFLEFVE